jgi:hypothetical protein
LLSVILNLLASWNNLYYLWGYFSVNKSSIHYFIYDLLLEE